MDNPKSENFDVAAARAIPARCCTPRNQRFCTKFKNVCGVAAHVPLATAQFLAGLPVFLLAQAIFDQMLRLRQMSAGREFSGYVEDSHGGAYMTQGRCKFGHLLVGHDTSAAPNSLLVIMRPGRGGVAYGDFFVNH